VTALLVRYGRPETLPLDLLLSSIPSLPRRALDRLAQRAIDRLDELDGDPDVEANGDELDGSLGEDDFHSHNVTPWAGPGCPIADPGGCQID
jgi:phage terminase Nu1 subunit (DNA packaging protein)